MAIDLNKQKTNFTMTEKIKIMLFLINYFSFKNVLCYLLLNLESSLNINETIAFLFFPFFFAKTQLKPGKDTESHQQVLSDIAVGKLNFPLCSSCHLPWAAVWQAPYISKQSTHVLPSVTVLASHPWTTWLVQVVINHIAKIFVCCLDQAQNECF